MVKRRLTSEEEKLERIGLVRNKNILRKLKTQLDYNLDVLELAKMKEKLDDKYRAHLRESVDEDNKSAIANIQSDIHMKEEIIRIAETNLKDGVEVKENKITG